MSASSSSSSLVLLAAHEQWLNSPRTIQDWAEFVDTIQHIIATKQHQIPPTQMTMGNAGVELPQNGIHGESVSGGLQSMAARFESLLDQLYLTQGYRNSHHTRTIVEDAAGASLPTTSLTPLRFLSATCYRSLKDLFLQQDVALEAIFLQYRDVGGASNPSGYKDFLHSLITLSQRWKRYIFFRDDPVDYLRQSRALFGLLEDYLAQRLITYGEYDFLENQLYNLSIGGVDELGSNGGGGESEFLLAAWSVAWTDLQSGVDVTKVADEFYDSILHLLENQIQLIYHRYTAEAREFLVQLNSNLNYRFAPATLKHLMSLIDHQTMLEEMKRRGDRRPLTKAEEELSRQSTLFFACFAESAASQNVYELIESLQVIGNAWRKTSPHLALLQCIRYVEEHGLLTASEADRAELLVYLEDGFLLSAWSVYEDADYTKSAFDEFIESVRVALEHEYRASITAIVREGYRLVNAWSATPDPVPILYSDPIRNEVLGIQRVPPHASVDLTRPFELPHELRHQLSSRDSEHLRALLRERDPVVLALLQEFHDTSNLADLTDGLTRCIARVEFGAAANAPKKRQYQQVAGNGNSSNVDVSQRYEFGDQQLDIYQLSQMLLSLHQDGYLSRDTLTQLLYAVQERHDPVLLAAFSIYKESLESNGGDESDSGWAEMWSILQLTWQRIQRDQRHMADARASQSSGAIGFLAPHDAILLRHVGTVLLDSLSASAAISITNVLYLRDLLRNGDPALYAILSLAEDGNIADSDETYDSLIALSQRWVKELDPIGQQLYRLLNSLAEAKFFSDAALDYLLGLVYARDPTLHGAFAVYAESAPNGTDSEEDDRDSEFEDEEDDDDDDDDDDDYDEDDDSEDDSDDEDEDDWSTYGDESDARDEYKYDSSSAGARASPRHHRRHSSLKRTPALPRALAEFVDSLHHLLSSGDRAIGELIGSEDESPRGLKSPLAQSISTEAQWEAEAQQVEPARKAAPISYGLPYFEE